MGKYFGTDGIRGIAGETLTADLAYKVGYFLGNYCKNNGKAKICLGKDTRLSSSMLESAITRGIVTGGSDAYLLGYCSTPCLAYVTEHEKFDLGIMVSASHNPYQYNGIKVFSNNGVKISDELATKVEQYIDGLITIEQTSDEQIGNVKEYQEGLERYFEWIESIYPGRLSEFKVLVDCANGSNSFIAERVLRDLGCAVKIINNTPNGININTNCGSTHLECLQEEIKKESFDFGFAFDGDADRVLFVDSNGDVVDGDVIMYILAKYLKDKEKLKDNTVVVTVMSNIGLYKALEKEEINLVTTSVGDKNVLDEMMSENFSLGGEQSGHVILLDDSRFGDGLKTALCMMAAIKSSGMSLADLRKEITIYPQVLENISVNDKDAVLNDENIKSVIEDIKAELEDDGRILVRPSGTESLVRVMVEAKTLEVCKELVFRVIDLIKQKGYQKVE